MGPTQEPALIDFDPASFKDPAGRVFYRDGQVYRALAPDAAADLAAANRAGLLSALVGDGLVIESELVPAEAAGVDAGAASAIVLRQRRVDFVSYSYEWSFEMLRDAALTTLAVTDRALGAGFILKDANAFNILFDGTVPRLVDVPSLQPYIEGRIWKAYRQFCRSFLFPLLLASYRGIDTRLLLRATLGELPAAVAAGIFGARDYTRPGVLKDVLLQARLERSFGGSATSVSREMAGAVYPKSVLVASIRRLRRIIERLPAPPTVGEWAAYDADCSYTADDRARKTAFVSAALGKHRDGRVVDLGCNSGTYSQLARASGARVVAIDQDDAAIDRLYRRTTRGDALSPVVADLLNPSPAMGWRLRERRSLLERLDADVFLALALIHHLRISGGVPLADVVRQLLALGSEGVIEWVDKKDAQVRDMLALRPDVYDDYTQTNFEAILAEQAVTVSVDTTHGGARRLYHVRAKRSGNARTARHEA